MKVGVLVFITGMHTLLPHLKKILNYFHSVSEIPGNYNFPLLNIPFQMLTVHIPALNFSSTLKSIIWKILTMYEIRKDLPFYVPLRIFKIFWFFDLDPNKKDRMTSIGKIMLLVTMFILEVQRRAICLIGDPALTCHLQPLCHRRAVGSFGFCFSCYKTMYNRQHFNKVLNDLTDVTRFGKPTTFDAETKKCNFFSKFFLFYTTAGVTFYSILSRFENRYGPCIRYQAETSDDLYCTAMNPVWVPFKLSFMIYEEVCLLVSHMESFSYKLRNVFRENQIERRSRVLAYCAEYHSHIINLALEVDELHRNITGHMALVWAISMGCIANQLLSMYKPIETSLFLAGYLMSLSCYVISGQTLQTESEAIAGKLYCTPWYLLSVEEQKIVMFMIMRAQIPLTLSAKPFGNYEYALFVIIVKTAYSYVTLLQSTI
nr:unnamed protein product [Callosobruchus chinensis]